MTNTNAQVALKLAVEIKYDHTSGYTPTHSVLRLADELLEWLDSKTEADKPLGVGFSK